MPYYTFDKSMLEEFDEGDLEEVEQAEEADPGEVTTQYEEAKATFDFKKASALVKTIHEALLQSQVDTVYIKYDGGNDEGFSYFESAQKAGQTLKDSDLQQLVANPLIQAAFESSFGGKMHESTKEYYAKLSPEERAKQWLEEFVEPLAVSLLGEGYGTGEYELRGRCKVNLQSGLITDLKDGEN